ncbi:MULTISPECIES: nucleoside hydrolase [Bacillaceae]|uniref:nucleoside hydrolase n=1 Tax=Bacillaceae TaxID=186817 RepID=UPI001C59548D|nr:nucleoside hydrolase [Rossellomorea sp. YZS02]MBW3112662.1 nucleoside hydrolase [Bacillus sp. MCCB 382]MDX8342639.1 nucleoside hydrolase [Rossellomorea sp. YZS02]
MKNIILFADPGIDDSIAIMYALLNPNIKVLGIVSSYGNVEKKQATDNIAYLLKLADRTDIPIIGGSNSPSSGKIPTYYPEIHGQEGLGPIRPPENFSGELTNFSKLYTIIEENQDVTIVDVGRNTSLASLYLLGEDITKKVKEFYIMGGAFFVPGNVTPSAEANFYGDPIASELVVKNFDNLYIAPLNVTNKAIVTLEHIKTIQEMNGNPVIEILDDVMTYYIDAYKKLIPGIGGAPLHDVVTLSLMVNPDMGKTIRRDVEVLTSGLGQGTSIADFRVSSKPAEKNINIYLEMDYQMFVEDFINVMTGKKG